MLRLLIILALVFTHLEINVNVNAQRGGYGGGGGGYGGLDGDWGENEEPPSTQVVTQVKTQVQTKVQTQTQVQTQVRTMVSTAIALSVAPTTVVQVQATTVVRVNTIISSIAPLSITPSTPNPSMTPSPSAANPDQSQSPLQQSEGLTVNNTPSSSQVQGDGITTRPIRAASEVSAPVTRLTGTVATLRSGMEFRTTGIPNLGDGAEGVVYGHVSLLNRILGDLNLMLILRLPIPMGLREWW
jgi:hypothetical protein